MFSSRSKQTHLFIYPLTVANECLRHLHPDWQWGKRWIFGYSDTVIKISLSSLSNNTKRLHVKSLEVIKRSAKPWIRRTVIKISGCSTPKINRLLSSILQQVYIYIYISNSFFRILKFFRAMNWKFRAELKKEIWKQEKWMKLLFLVFCIWKILSFFFLFPV